MNYYKQKQKTKDLGGAHSEPHPFFLRTVTKDGGGLLYPYLARGKIGISVAHPRNPL
jgi:hypothetical protein